jgi:hypothetical protein
MERVMIQADRTMLAQARAAARERGLSFPAFVRAAIEHELLHARQPELSCVGIIDTSGRARSRQYEPDQWR